MAKKFFYEIFTSDFHLTRIKLNRILDKMSNELLYLTEDDLFDLRVVYNELIANALTHGNRLDITKKVELFIKSVNYVIMSSVKDEGLGFDYSRVYTWEGRDKKACERGRGLQLVASLVDHYEWNPTGNEISFYKTYINR